MDDTVNIDDLVNRSKLGKVSAREIEQVAVMLMGDHCEEATYSLLYVIGRSFARSHEDLVVTYLECRENPMVARLALQILCSFWDLADQYQDQIQRFIDGVDWDIFGEVRQVAISAAGQYLRSHKNSELLHGLLELTLLDNDSAVERRVAIEAAATALDYPVPETLKGKGPWEQWAAEVLTQAHLRLAAEGAA